MILWSVARLGWFAKAARIAARKKCPMIWKAFFPMCFPSRLRIESVNILAVSGLPFRNEKTAEFGVMLTVLMKNSFFNAEYGQQLLKISTKSPPPNGCYWLQIPFCKVNAIPCKFFKIVFLELQGRISSSQKDPKNVMQHAAHNVILLLIAHWLFAIPWPKILGSGNVSTNFAGLKSLYRSSNFWHPWLWNWWKNCFQTGKGYS